MGLFDSSDDDDEESGDGPQAHGSRTEHEGTTATRQQVETLVDDLQSSRLQHTDLVERLNESPETRLVAARALVRATIDDPDAVEDIADKAVDRFAERELARPVAESLLRSAANLHAEEIEYVTVVEGALDALDEALGRIESVRTERPGEVLGGGASEVALAAELREYADSVRGRHQLVIETTADAFEAVPRELARQAGLDPIDTLVDMRTEREMGNVIGIGTVSGDRQDAQELAEDEQDVKMRLTDGVALAAIVALTYGTVTQLGTLTGYHPYYN